MHVCVCQMELSGVVERHRFLLLELHECYCTYLMRRDQMTDAVDQLKHYQHLQAAASDQQDINTISKIVSPDTHTHSLSLSLSLSLCLCLSDLVCLCISCRLKPCSQLQLHCCCSKTALVTAAVSP